MPDQVGASETARPAQTVDVPPAKEAATVTDPDQAVVNQTVAAAAASGINGESDPRAALEKVVAALKPRELQGKGKRLELKVSAAELKPTIDALKNNNDLKAKALGFDLEVALVQRDLAGFDVLINQERARGADIDQTRIDEKRAIFRQKINQLKTERAKALVDKDGKTVAIKSGVVELALKLADSDQEIQASQDNPLGLIEDKYNKALRNKDLREDFVARLRSLEEGLPDADKSGWNELIDSTPKLMDSTLSQEQALKLKEKANMALKIGGGIGIFAILLLWIATKQNKGGSQ